MKKNIEIGQRFGRLVIVKEVEHHKMPSGRYRRMFLCKCDCGNEVTCSLANLTSGNTSSCGCFRKETTSNNNSTHRQSKTRLYRCWQHMKHRCYREDDENYSYYGGRGITMCDEWKDSYENFSKWAIDNGYKDNLTIDRINNDKGYYPDNCRWATAKQQVNNTRVNHRITFNGETHTVSEWAQILNVTPMSIFRRLYKGWSEEEALTIPRFGKRTIQKEPMTTQDIMNVCKQSISCGLCKNKKEFCEMSGISKYVFFSIQKGLYKISDGIYLKVKAMQDKIETREKRQ